MTERGTTERRVGSEWTLMNALHDAFRRDLHDLLATSAGRSAIRSLVRGAPAADEEQ
jgi:hypothetical protein